YVKNREVLDAIAWHTTGHPGMGLLEKILFVADYIEPNRDRQPDLVEIRALAFRDLDRCVCRIAGDTVRYLEASGRKAVDPMTRATYEYYRDLTEGEERNGK
ncbi:MAG: HD domain-containing protein, partial [Lachnospiraceae bacterium]|nr:HD domain-containing protein [Lachnospiraceae bacterium]